MNLESFITRLRNDQRGATAVEYGLICALIVLAMLGALKGFAEENARIWNKVNSASEKAVSASGD